MPKMGLVHDLLSPRHRDTSPPADGADPDDGQVVTWSDLLGAWHAADPAGGVTDHGALTGLVPDDDHTQYALADKTRPSPWVHADDLWGKSIADFGTRHHHDLQFLTTDDHPVYINIYGRPGGQTVLGATGSGEHLTLQSTSHATRGYVRVQDALQLLSDIIRDSGGNVRITLGTSSPEVSLAGDVVASGHLAVGADAVMSANQLVYAEETITGSPAAGGRFAVKASKASGGAVAYGLQGAVQGQGTPTYQVLLGLFFFAQHNSSSTCIQLSGISMQIQSGAAGSGAISTARGFHLGAGYWGNRKPTVVRGLDIENQGGAGTGTAEAIKAVDQTAATVRLLELGPAVPYLRVVGGLSPGANNTNLYMSEGSVPTLRRLQTKDGAAIGGGDLVCVLV